MNLPEASGAPSGRVCGDPLLQGRPGPEQQIRVGAACHRAACGDPGAARSRGGAGEGERERRRAEGRGTEEDSRKPVRNDPLPLSLILHSTGPHIIYAGEILILSFSCILSSTAEGAKLPKCISARTFLVFVFVLFLLTGCTQQDPNITLLC